MDMFHVIYLITPVWRNGARVFPPVTSVRGPLMQSIVMASLWGLGRCTTATREWGALLTQCWADLLPPVLLLIPEVNYDLPIFNNLFGWYLLNLATDKPHNDSQRGHIYIRVVQKYFFHFYPDFDTDFYSHSILDYSLKNWTKSFNI